MARDMDELCEKSTSIEVPIKGGNARMEGMGSKGVGCYNSKVVGDYGRGKGLKLRGGMIVGELLRGPKTARSSTSRTNSPTGISRVNFFEK